MKLALSLHEITRRDRSRIGGKAFALARMQRRGLHVPEALCISTDAYMEYLRSTGFGNQMHMELFRKSFDEMRWEEIWDTSLRIRSLFIRTPMQSCLQEQLKTLLAPRFSEQPVSVRSSAPGEDAARTSFAGLHESFVNIRGMESILEHIRLVWASLWSDRALLYRQELGLDLEKSAMAVVVQEMVLGERSGVAFGMSPVHEGQSVIEAVYGLNQGLVDGTLEPDRWSLDRDSGRILSHHAALREKILVPVPQGVRSESLPRKLRHRAPLRNREVKEVYGLVMKAETLFGSPQDMEWTYSKQILHALQARPITTSAPSSEDQRPWYLSLHRRFDNLKSLRTQIETELISRMEKEAHEMSLMDFSALPDSALAQEIRRRRRTHKKWTAIYRRDCIPFAHGMRLFGKIYNDLMKPEDPFQFMTLLRSPDDDNISMAKIDGQVLAAVAEAIRRLKERPVLESEITETDDLLRAVQSESSFNKPNTRTQPSVKKSGFSLKSRQILGQPAGPGMAMGKARVVLDASDLFSFLSGEILVCDAVDPAMTFVVPLASGIVEKRGGMLIHGAIIAREYGIPCVTGVPDAVNQIRTGDFITVDGHLGIVIIGEASL